MGEACFICWAFRRRLGQPKHGSKRCTDCNRNVCNKHVRSWHGKDVCKDCRWLRERWNLYGTFESLGLPAGACYICYYFDGHRVHTLRESVKDCGDCGQTICRWHQRRKFPTVLCFLCFDDFEQRMAEEEEARAARKAMA